MADIFKVNAKQILQFSKWAAFAPVKFRKALMGYLNTSAFGSRRKSLSIIDRNMTIRAPGFIHSSIRVQKAVLTTTAGTMAAYMGSVERKRYSGLVEQETGQPWNAKRTATTAGRGGSDTNIMPRQYRMGRRHRLLTDVVDRMMKGRQGPLNRPASRITAALAILRRKNDQKPFLILGAPGRRSGLYKLDGDHLVMLQRIRRRALRPKRVLWLSGGVEKFYQFNKPVAIFQAELARQGLRMY